MPLVATLSITAPFRVKIQYYPQFYLQFLLDFLFSNWSSTNSPRIYHETRDYLRYRGDCQFLMVPFAFDRPQSRKKYITRSKVVIAEADGSFRHIRIIKLISDDVNLLFVCDTNKVQFIIIYSKISAIFWNVIYFAVSPLPLIFLFTAFLKYFMPMLLQDAQESLGED